MPAVIQVSDETNASLQRVCELREMDADAAIGFMSRCFAKEPRLYDPEDTLEFGKYYGEIFDDVMKMDPGYAAWMHNTATGVGLTQKSLVRLHNLTFEPNRNRRKQGNSFIDDAFAITPFHLESDQ